MCILWLNKINGTLIEIFRLFFTCHRLSVNYHWILYEIIYKQSIKCDNFRIKLLSFASVRTKKLFLTWKQTVSLIFITHCDWFCYFFRIHFICFLFIYMCIMFVKEDKKFMLLDNFLFKSNLLHTVVIFVTNA